jgi:transcriptional regulator with XRE-family HTH domain
MTASRNSTPHPIDVYVGQRVRERRRGRRGSQQSLAAQLNISFQQLQKYERGTNRISASMLYKIAAALEVPISYFFEGLHGPGIVKAGSHEDGMISLAGSPEGIEILKYFYRLSPKAREIVVTAVKGMAELPFR